MKKTILMLTIVTSAMIVSAQESPKQKEVGLVFNSLNNFGITLKTGTEKKLWRFTTLMANNSNREENADSLYQQQKSTGFELGIGKEFRQPITENIDLRYGADLAFSYSYSKSEENDLSINGHDYFNESKIFRPGIAFVLGLNYNINDNLIFGVELLPRISYQTGKSTEKRYYINDGQEIVSDISGFDVNLSNNSALITMAYCF
jgi:hypothetical protein